MRIWIPRIEWAHVLVFIIAVGAVSLIYNVASSPVEHLRTEHGCIIRMYIDEDWIPPTYDSKGRMTSAGYWDEDFYITIEFNSGSRSSFGISERRWRREFAKGDKVTVDYFKRGVLHYHEINRVMG